MKQIMTAANILLLAVCQSNKIGNSNHVNPGAIYGTYSAERTEGGPNGSFGQGGRMNISIFDFRIVQTPTGSHVYRNATISQAYTTPTGSNGTDEEPIFL